MRFQRKSPTQLYTYLGSTLCFYLLSLGASLQADAATTEDYLRALQPPSSSQEGQMRGFGGTVAAPAAQQNPEVNIPLHFARNSADLLPNAMEKLSRLSRALEDDSLRNYTFVIEGHTCDLGSNGLNMNLSKRRAFSVTAFLSRNSSLAPNQFAVQWYGEDRPAEPNVNENARQRNRRVVIRNTLKTVDVALNGQRAELQIFKMQNGHKKALADGDRLRSGAQYSIAFKSATEPYVYVCQLDAGGQAALLFPNPDISSRQSNPVTPGASYQVPESGVSFYLDNVTGTEQFVMLTHQMPVQNPTLACATAIKNVEGEAQTRGVGGIKNINSPVSSAPTAIADSNLQLCEIMCDSGTRGVGGITSMNTNPALVASAPGNGAGGDASCQGFFLKRFFLHE